MALGLLVSASWTSSEAAVGTLPLLLIPQSFSSIMVSVRSMGELAQLFSWLTVQRYAFDAVIKCGNELAYFKYGLWQRQRVRGFLYELGLKGSAGADDLGLSLLRLSGAMVGFIACSSRRRDFWSGHAAARASVGEWPRRAGGLEVQHVPNHVLAVEVEVPSTSKPQLVNWRLAPALSTSVVTFTRECSRASSSSKRTLLMCPLMRFPRRAGSSCRTSRITAPPETSW